RGRGSGEGPSRRLGGGGRGRAGGGLGPRRASKHPSRHTPEECAPMTATESALADWRIGFESLEAEIRQPVELDVEGRLPGGAAGDLYLVGPARHEVFGSRNADWFDGDGMVHRFTVRGGRVRYHCRFVETAKKQAEDARGRRRYGTFGTPPAGGALARIRRGLPMSTA